MNVVFNDSRLQCASWTGKLVDQPTPGTFPANTRVGHYNKQAAMKQKFILEGPGDLKVTYKDGTEETYKDVPAATWRMLCNKGSSYFFYNVKNLFAKA